MKKQRIDDKFNELSIASEKLHHLIQTLGENQTPVLCELVVNFALRDVVIQKGYPDSYELDINDLIDATRLSIALVENIDGITKH